MREHLKKEIRKEMKIKEGAEKLKEVTTDKKSMSDVQSIVKKSNNKLKELQNDLQEINAYLLVSNSTSFHDTLSGNVISKIYILVSDGFHDTLCQLMSKNISPCVHDTLSRHVNSKNHNNEEA